MELIRFWRFLATETENAFLAQSTIMKRNQRLQFGKLEVRTAKKALY